MDIAPFDTSPNELFRLDPARLERSLAEIAVDPYTVLGRVATALMVEDPGLVTILHIVQQNMDPTSREAFTDAIFLTRKIMADAGVPPGSSLPRLSNESTKEFNRLTKGALSVPGIKEGDDITAYLRHGFEPMLNLEPSIQNVIADLGRYRIGREGYYAGAAMVVAGLRIAAQQ